MPHVLPSRPAITRPATAPRQQARETGASRVPSRLASRASRLAAGLVRCTATALLAGALTACAAPTPATPGATTTPAAAAAPATAPAPLRGTTWTLAAPVSGAAAAGSGTAAPGKAGRGPFLQLDPQSDRYSGHAGCNRIMGRYVLEGPSLRLLTGASTRMACLEEARMQQEQAFLAALAQVQGWRLQGTRLQLLDAGGQVLLTLQDGAAPAAPAGR
jgi:heat shock protein HslJ